MNTGYNPSKNRYQNRSKFRLQKRTCHRFVQKPILATYMRRLYRQNYALESSQGDAKEPHSGGGRDD